MAGVSLQERGWFLSDEGIEQCSQSGKSDADSIIRTALNTDLREIGKGWLPEEMNRGKADYVQGPGVLQLQKIRNVSAPKDNEDSQAAPRLMKLSLTDGQITCNAVETEVLNGIGSSTPPGSKILLKMTVDVEHGFLLLNNKNTKNLGGRVDKLAESWELKRKLAKQQRSNFSGEGGPPLFVPFGQRISSDSYNRPTSTRRDNFKSLETNKVEKGKTTEEEEFEQLRKAALAEALQVKEDGQTKKFGGGLKVSDQDVARITEMGFQADDATAALKQNNGNFQQALDSLLRQGPGPRGSGRPQSGGPNRQTSYESDRSDRGRGRRDRKEDDNGGGPRGGRRGRDEDPTDVNSKPSGPATLFDFLNKKIGVGEGKADSKPSTRNQPDSNFKETRERTRNNSDHSNYNKSDSQHTVPPRFSNKAKTENYQGHQGQNSRGQGRYHDDQRSERSRDDRPRTAPNDNRNFNDKRNYNNKNDSDRNYGERNDRNKNYGERNDRNRNRWEGNYSDRQYNESEGRGRGGGRDSRGEGKDYKQGERRNYNTDNQKSASANYSKSSANVNNRQSDTKGASEPQSRDKDSSRGQNNQKSSKEDSRVGDSQSRNFDKNDQSASRNYQKSQNPRRDQYNQFPDSQSRQDVYSKGGNSRQSQSQRGGNSQQTNYVQNYPPNSTTYGNYNNNSGVNTSGGQYQPSPEYIYTESQPSGTFSIQQGDKVMAKYWEDGMFYDAMVEVIAPGMPTCVVTFTEYGNQEEVFLQDIRPCLPQMMPPHGATVLSVPDLSVPPPQVFYPAQPPHVSGATMEDVIQGMGSMEFRRGGGGQPYGRKDNNRPQQQYYQPPASRR